MHPISLKRIYDPPAPEDGRRVLVDRLWPRGVSRDSAAIDAWLKEIAPSDALRKWYGHRPERWPEFRERYLHELKASERQQAVALLRQWHLDGPLTLLFATREKERNNAAVLREFLLKEL